MIFNFKSICLWTIILCAISFAQAADPTNEARVDISAKDDVKLTVYKEESTKSCSFDYQKWLKGDSAIYSHLWFQTIKLPADKWTQYKFVFSAEKDTSVKLSFVGNWSKNNQTKKMNRLWINYDNITVEGATLKNGDFEESKSGKPVSWNMQDAENYIVDEEVKAQSGKAFVKVWYFRNVTQYIPVTAGQKVTVTFYAMPGEVEMQ